MELTEGQRQALATAIPIIAQYHDVHIAQVIIEQLRPLLNPELPVPNYEDE